MTTNDTRSLHNDLAALGLDDSVINAWIDDDAKLGSESYAATRKPVWWQDETSLHQMCDDLGYSQYIRDVFLTANKRIKKEGPAWWTLLAIASGLFLTDDNALRGGAIKRTRPPRDRWGELVDLLPVLIQFTAIKTMVQRHRAMGIDAQVTRDTADDLPLRMEEFERKHGSPGTTDDQYWFNNHIRGKLYMLGRLQFVPGDLDLPCVVLGNEQNQYVALALGDHKVRADGQWATADREVALKAPDNWTTSLRQTNDAIIGHAINKQGCIEPKLSTFPLSQWKIALKAGDIVLTVHIPARGRLDTQACLDSFTQALAFYPKFFPKLNAKAFTCVSWLMDPQLKLLEESCPNLGQFIRLFHSVPVRTNNDRQMFERVFDNQTDLKTLPRDNALRRALIAHMEQGQKWRVAGGYRMID